MARKGAKRRGGSKLQVLRPVATAEQVKKKLKHTLLRPQPHHSILQFLYAPSLLNLSPICCKIQYELQRKSKIKVFVFQICTVPHITHKLSPLLKRSNRRALLGVQRGKGVAAFSSLREKPYLPATPCGFPPLFP